MLNTFSASTNLNVLRPVLEYLLPGKIGWTSVGIIIVKTINFLLKENGTTVIRRYRKL